MIVIFYGTSAELIKMLGIIKGVPRDQQLLICTSQQRKQISYFHEMSGIEPDIYLSQGWKGGDVVTMTQMLLTMLAIHGNFAKQFGKIKSIIKKTDKKYKTKSIVLVHGDTLTTVVGAYLGRALGLPVGHVEAGLRSGRIMHPFPEEIDRRIVAKIARVHYSPTKRAVDDLKKESTKGEIINTQLNTSKDALDQSEDYVTNDFKKLKLPTKYGLVSIHRTELLERKAELKQILEAIYSYSLKSALPLVFVDHSTTEEKIKTLGFNKYLQGKNIVRIPKQPYFDFMQIVKNAEFIVTDSGGLQEDAFFVGVPTMIHRLATERQEGLGYNVQLSGLDIKKVIDFLNNPPKKDQFKAVDQKLSPSQIVISHLRKSKFIS
ncbi:MAG TPA: UDP-N-acetylglucosamine 2-epimerase [Candidatus Saccharimonadales bacterium]|nr:UDP-N-acetylglucosamine 2-epimerase [Candidatus Saccharimonadales bacterium]